jgi:hypothetical protein
MFERYTESRLPSMPLARAGNQGRGTAQEAFKKGLAELEIEGETPPALKKKLLMACVACISHDRWMTLEEFEILRAVADSMDLPVPPRSSRESYDDMSLQEVSCHGQVYEKDLQESGPSARELGSYRREEN